MGDYEPCDACKKLREQGIDLVEATDFPTINPRQPAWHGAYPTGRHMIFRENAIRAIFTPDVADDLCKRRIGFMDKEAFENLQKLIERK